MIPDTTQLRDCFISPNVPDDNLEAANVVDVIQRLARSGYAIRDSITPNCVGSSDAYGGHVTSLTEAVMGMTGALMSIASALNAIADKMPEQT